MTSYLHPGGTGTGSSSLQLMPHTPGAAAPLHTTSTDSLYLQVPHTPFSRRMHAQRGLQVAGRAGLGSRAGHILACPRGQQGRPAVSAQHLLTGKVPGIHWSCGWRHPSVPTALLPSLPLCQPSWSPGTPCTAPGDRDLARPPRSPAPAHSAPQGHSAPGCCQGGGWLGSWRTWCRAQASWSCLLLLQEGPCCPAAALGGNALERGHSQCLPCQCGGLPCPGPLPTGFPLLAYPR